MKREIQSLLEKWFSLKPEEMQRALPMQGIIFLLIFTLLVVKPTANSLFLTKFGVNSLPYAYLLIAIVAVIVSTVYTRLLVSFPLTQLMRYTLIGCIGALIIFCGLLHLDLFESLTLYSFYLWVMIYAVLTTSQFWILANQVFNVREAKRLFGFIGVGAIAGGIVGGYSASLLVPFIGSYNLLFVGALCLLPCLFLINQVSQLAIPKKPIKNKVNKKQATPIAHPVRLIQKSKHLLYLSSIVGISVIAAKLIDYQFSDIAARHYPDKNDLTAFFGFWFSTFNVLSLLFQLFLTKRIMETVGVSRALFLLPVLTLLVGAIMLVMPELLFVAIGLKMTDGTLKQSVNKAAMELLVLPIPTKIKNSAKTFIDVVIDSVATGLSGILILVVIKGMQLPSYAITLLIVLFAALWILLVYRIRKEYLSAFKLKLDKSLYKTPVFKGTPTLYLADEKMVRQVGVLLEEGTDNQIIKLLKRIKPIKKKKLLEKTIALFHHSSPEIRAAAIRNVNTYKKPIALEEVTPLLQDDSIKVRAKALEYIILHDEQERMNSLEEHLDDDEYQMRGTAIVALATLSRQEPTLANEFHLQGRLFDWFHKAKNTKDLRERRLRIKIFLQAIGRGRIEDCYAYISQYLTDEDPEVVRQAILAAGKTQKEVFLNQLISFLETPIYRHSTQVALSAYKEKVFPLFIEVFNNPNTSIKIIRAIPKVVRKVNSQQAVNLLDHFLTSKDLIVRQKTLRGLNRLRHQQQDYQFNNQRLNEEVLEESQLFQQAIATLYQMRQLAKTEIELHPTRYKIRTQLVILLEKKLDNNLERLFLILGLRYAPVDMINIYRSIRGSKAEVRINALEFLDNLLGINLKKIIIPIVETAVLESITEQTIQQLNVSIPSERDCIKDLLLLKDVEITKLIIDLLATLPEREWKDVRSLAIHTLHQLQPQSEVDSRLVA